MRHPSIYYAVDKEDVDLNIDRLEHNIEETIDPIVKSMLQLELEIYKNIRTEYPVYQDNEWRK